MARKSRKIEKANTVLECLKIYRCGLYSRLSDEDRNDLEENSIGNQKKICMDFVNRHSDIVLVKTYVDNGFTGTNFQRDGFIQMMKDIEAGEIDCVIVKDLSRFGREYIGAGELLERIFPEKKIRFIAVSNNYDSLEMGNGNGIALPITNIANEFYSRDTSRKIRSAIQTKIQAGEYMASSSSVPYGYIRGENCFLVDHEVKDVVIRIYELRKQGMAFNAIARSLNEDHIMSPGRLRYERGLTKRAAYEQAVWSRKAVREILNDEVYLGHRIHGKVKREKLGTPKRRTDASTWQYAYNVHEPIISKELFDAVQKVNKEELLRLEAFHARGMVKDDFRSVLSGKIFCGDCKARMSSIKRNQRSTSPLPPVINYQCSRYGKYQGSCECFNHYIPQPEILAQIKKYLDIRLPMVTEAEKMLQELRRPKEVNRELYSVRKKKVEYEEKKEHLWRDYTDQLLNKEEYLYAKKRFDMMYQELCLKEDELQKKEDEKNRMMSEAARWVEFMKKYQKVQELDQQMIEMFVQRIDVYGGRRIEIVMNYKDELLEQCFREVCGKEKRYAG